MDVVGDGLWYEGHLIATIHENAVSPTLLADFIDDIRAAPEETEEYAAGRDAANNEAEEARAGELEEAVRAERAACAKIAQETYAKFCELLR